MPRRRYAIQPDPRMPTELALASDGTIYVTLEGRLLRNYAGRAIFTGYALRRAEVARIGVRRLLMWALFARLAVGSDGRVYVDEHHLPEARGRKIFRGFATTAPQAARFVAELHRMAFNVFYSPR